MIALARYAEAHVVARSMSAELLVRQDYDGLLRATTIAEAWTALRKTAYGSALPELTAEQPAEIELIVRAASAARFARSIRRLHGRATAIGTLLLSRWELEALEYTLRIWHGKYTAAPLPRASVAHGIAFETLRDAGSLTDVAIALRKTPYATPVYAVVNTYAEKQSIFFVEVALEKDYYQRLLKAIGALGGNDARDGLAVIGAEIDSLNLSWISRLLQYGAVPAADIAQTLVPGPTALCRQLLSPNLGNGGYDGIVARAVGRIVPTQREAIDTLQHAAMLEHVVGEMALASAYKMLGSYPFRITCVMAYYLLCRAEQQNLCAVFAGKAAGMSGRDIEARLRGLR